MTDHYFTPSPQSESRPARFETRYRGHTLLFETDSGVFSRTGLDKGTETLLNALPADMGGRLLDMGCGYGALGVSIAAACPGCRLTMADINQRAALLAAGNARLNRVEAETVIGDGFSGLAGRTFDWIVTNPPIRAGKKVIYRLFADAAAALAQGGRLALVIRKQQGAPSARAYLETLFARAEIIARSAGYWVIQCDTPLARQGENREEMQTESDGNE